MRRFILLIKDGSINKLQIDSYEREIERYDSFGIEKAEQIFAFDSDCIIKLVGKIKVNNRPHDRELIAFKSIDIFLSDFGLDLPNKQLFVNEAMKGLSREFNPYASKLFRRQLNAKYSNLRKQIETIIKEDGELYSDYIEIINERSVKNQPIIYDILKLIAKKKIMVDLFSLLNSYLHMSVNRLFVSDQRFSEYVIYELLHRYYTSEIARQKLD